MSTEDQEDPIFGEFEGEFLEFDRITPKNRLSNRPDLHAFLLLDQLVPGDRDMIDGARHDEISLNVDPEHLKKIASIDQLRDLHRCGIRHDVGNPGSLVMFV